jgi:AAT family amino acid transporter
MSSQVKGDEVQLPRAEAVPDVPDEGYRRGLSSRQVQMMALGSAIGVGLFYGSGGAIAAAGPAIIATFIAAGLIGFLVMRALGELIVYRPTSGSFMEYAKEFLGPFAAFSTGWSYWLAAVTVCMAEVTAAGHYVAYWFPDVPIWLTAAVALAILLLANLLSVKVFGELEFWFASIKVIAILVLICLGAAVLIFGFSSLGEGASIQNLWEHGGFAPNGTWQMVFMLQAVFFAYTGIELVGSTAGEAVDPRRTLRSAINLLPLRIGVFYIGSLVVILSLMPWTQYNADSSPFVQVFSGIGLPAAAGIMNFVVLTAALSGCNANMYMASRLARRMSTQGEAPALLGRLNARHVPMPALALTAVVIGVGIVINLAAPEKAFSYITSVATCAVMWAWTVILISHLRYRASVRAGRLPASDFKMPGAPLTNWIALGSIALVVVLLGRNADGRVTLYVGVAWTLLLAAGYTLINRIAATRTDEKTPHTR